MEADVKHCESRKLRITSPLRKVKACVFALNAVVILMPEPARAWGAGSPHAD